MEKKLFGMFFILIPVLALSVLIILKFILKNKNFWDAFESTLPLLFFYYLASSIFWLLNLDKIKNAEITTK